MKKTVMIPICIAALLLTVLLAGMGSRKDDAAAAYEPIIHQYRTALEENWDGQQLVDGGLNFMILQVPRDAVGYTIADPDNNGTDELIIGTIYGDGFYGKLIFDLYTQNENGPVPVFSSIERNRIYYAGDAQFANIGSSAYDSSFDTTLRLEDGTLTDLRRPTDPRDYVQLQLTPIISAKLPQD